LAGSLIAIVCFQNKMPFNFYKKNSLILNIILPILIFFIFCWPIQLYSFNSLVCSFLIGLLIVCNINQHTIFSDFLNNRYIVTIGKLSYSIYIWQQLFSGTNGQLGVLSRLPLNIALIVLFSYCSYHFFEKKFLRLKNGFYSKEKLG
jgi:peptidoglycan/LPS O-acetylase OafA/YrhL